MKEWTDDEIWAFLDGSLDNNEVLLFEKSLETNKLLEKRLDNLVRLEDDLKEFLYDKPSMRFTKNVLDKIESVNSFKERYKKPVFSLFERFVMGASSIAVVSMIIVIIATAPEGVKDSPSATEILLSKLSSLIESLVPNIHLPELGLNPSLMFLGIAMILAFFILDKTLNIFFGRFRS